MGIGEWMVNKQPTKLEISVENIVDGVCESCRKVED